MNGFRLALLTLLLQNLVPQTTPITTPPAGTASVEGIVVKLGTNDPIAGADIELTIQSQPLVQPAQNANSIPPYSARSGSDGRFAFRNVGAGNYKLVAARIGGNFTPFEYGQRGTLGRGVTFPIANGEQKKDMRLEMAPVGSITGRILDMDNPAVQQHSSDRGAQTRAGVRGTGRYDEQGRDACRRRVRELDHSETRLDAAVGEYQRACP